MSNKELTEGWGFPLRGRTFHYFRSGRALCGRWLFLGELSEDSEKPTREDCKTCWKKRQAEKAKSP